MKLQHKEKVKDLAPSEEVGRPHILLLKGTSAFLQHVLWEQGLHILPLSCIRMKALGPVPSFLVKPSYLPSCCLLYLTLKRKEEDLKTTEAYLIWGKKIHLRLFYPRSLLYFLPNETSTNLVNNVLRL